MDPRDRGESKSERRQELMARRIGGALDKMDLRGAGDCPDGEILAAYSERGLTVAEAGKWESHFATCSRCRTILLVLNESADTPLAEKEVALLAESTATMPVGAQQRHPGSGRAWPWLADWRVRWLAPALGVAAALAVLLVLRPPARRMQQAASETFVAQAPKQELPPLPAAPGGADRLSRVAPSAPQAFQAIPRAERPSSPEAAPLNSPAGSAAKGRAEVGAPTDKFLAPEVSKKFSAPQDKVEAQTPSSSPSPSNSPASQGAVTAPAAPPPPAKPAPNMAAGEAANANANAVDNSAPREEQVATGRGAAVPNAATGSAVPQISSEARLNQRKEEMFALIRPLQNDSSVLKAPSGSTLWRLGVRGTVERSTDGAKTWVLQATPTREDWLAGAAVSDAVCWLIGRSGTIARTLDGEHWQSIAPPPQAVGPNLVLPDWVGIAATDAQAATITSSDGRRFATADGGKTWRPL